MAIATLSTVAPLTRIPGSAVLPTAGASWTATAAGIDQYALKEFTADF
ncbi:hypothetical protein OPU76_28025, partial [Klebsiella pneumoniae]|nr:hypothetical protein [Klebsiella pneumoniae]